MRLYKIDNPVADWHSWRQADTAAVARNFYKEGFNPLYPKGDDMSSISDTPGPNLKRLRFVEFPIYNSLVYFTYLVNGGVDERLARLVNIVISLGSLLFIYFITKRFFDKFTALIAAFLFAVLPYNVFYSRVILPEPMLVFFGLGMFYFTDRWIKENTLILYIVSVIFAACAFLTKPTAIFFALPLLVSYISHEKKIVPPLRYFLWILPVTLPFIGWRWWIQQYPQGIPAASWLLNGNGIRFKPAFWRWIVGDRLGREILSGVGVAFFLLGILIRPLKGQSILLHLLALSSFLYLIVFATGNVQHDYYQIIIVPALVIFTARGFTSLFKGFPNFLPRLVSIPLAVFLLTIALYLGWYEVKGLYQINNWSIVKAGIAADRLLPKDAVVVAPYGGDTAFLYQTNRIGLPLFPAGVEDAIENYGVQYLVSVAQDTETKQAMEKYQVIKETKEYVIVDLNKKK